MKTLPSYLRKCTTLNPRVEGIADYYFILFIEGFKIKDGKVI